MSASDFVFLTGGLTVPLPALQVLWRLENRGVSFALDGDGIIARPRATLTEDDRAVIRRYRQHIIAILTYQEQERAQ